MKSFIVISVLLVVVVFTARGCKEGCAQMEYRTSANQMCSVWD